jgi:hypothetical protein
VRAEQVVVVPSTNVEDVPLQVFPEVGIRDWQLADLLALREDREALALVIEVLELDRAQGPLADAVVEQESQSDPIP